MVKVISLSEDAYNVLKQLKRPKTSFSDIIIENLGSDKKNKTLKITDILEWIEKHKSPSNKKENISENIDKILYGASRDDS